MTGRHRLTGLAAGLICVLAGCSECVHGSLGQEVARLSVRDLEVILELVETDAGCGFASEGARSGTVVDGAAGSEGVLTSAVADCVIDLGTEGRRLREDCLGDAPTARGKITVTARRTLAGTVTGNPNYPILPTSPDALRVTLDVVRFDNFSVTRPSADASLLIRRGSLSAVAEPLLAVAADTGACVIPTPNVRFRGIAFESTQMVLSRPDERVDLNVARSDIAAQLGRQGAVENELRGTMTILDSDVDVTGDEILDNEYQRVDYLDRYRCQGDLARPINFQCNEFANRHRDDAARAGVGLLAALAQLAEREPSCGFASRVVEDAAVLDVDAVSGMGTLTLSMVGCRVEMETPLALSGDCDGSPREIQGRVILDGQKTIHGRLTGDAENPVVPVASNAMTITLHASLEGVRASGLVADGAIFRARGTIEGAVRPVLYANASSGACTITSPHADFSNVRWADAEMVVSAADGAFPVSVESSRIQATMGVTESGRNRLEGIITIGGEEREVGSDRLGLEPGFEADVFAESWECEPSLAQPPTTECGAESD